MVSVSKGAGPGKERGQRCWKVLVGSKVATGMRGKTAGDVMGSGNSLCSFRAR